jgi:SNF2 family DNA or RNA helicase
MAAYPYKTEPFPHQREALKQTMSLPGAALFMAPGTGKTKVLIDTAGYHYLKGNITGLFVLAPAGVHRQWVEDEICAHMPDEIPFEAFLWRSGWVDGRYGAGLLESFLRFQDGLPILVMNIDAVLTQKGRKYSEKFLRTRTCMMVVDESSDISTPGAKRTKVVKTLGKRARIRRIADGTPVDEGPLRVYAPMTFADPTAFAHLGVRTYQQFKDHFAEWEEREFGEGIKARVVKLIKKEWNPETQSLKPVYKNLDQLHAAMRRIGFFAPKELLGLPPKMYVRRTFEPSDIQKRMITELQIDFTTEFDSGESVTAELAITRQLRESQITAGYVPTDIVTDDSEPNKLLPGPNPRLEALIDEIKLLSEQAIIWCRFRMDIDLITAALSDSRITWGRYDGAVSQDTRDQTKHMFQNGSIQFFIGNVAAGGRGLTLTNAKHVLWYTNYFSLLKRNQGEDRAHRIGTVGTVRNVDFICSGTVDEKIRAAHMNKQEVADYLTKELK